MVPSQSSSRPLQVSVPRVAGRAGLRHAARRSSARCGRTRRRRRWCEPRPSSVVPSQSSSMPLQVSVRRAPGAQHLRHARRRTAAHGARAHADAARESSRAPSSVLPSQSSSTPLQISALGGAGRAASAARRRRSCCTVRAHAPMPHVVEPRPSSVVAVAVVVDAVAGLGRRRAGRAGLRHAVRRSSATVRGQAPMPQVRGAEVLVDLAVAVVVACRCRPRRPAGAGRARLRHAADAALHGARAQAPVPQLSRAEAVVDLAVAVVVAPLQVSPAGAPGDAGVRGAVDAVELVRAHSPMPQVRRAESSRRWCRCSRRRGRSQTLGGAPGRRRGRGSEGRRRR